MIRLARFAPLVLCSLAFLHVAPLGSAQATWYVDVTATPPGSGTPESPYASIQYALSRPTTLGGDTVLVLPGTYFENLDFLGKAVHVVSSGGRTVTAIDGGGPGVGQSVVSFTSGEGPGSVLQGFTVTNGYGPLDVPLGLTEGGGVRIVGASPTIRDCQVQRNEADHGAGVFSENGSPWIEDCLVIGNLWTINSSGCGGWFDGGSPWLVDVVVEFNGVANWGGGLYFEASLPSLLRTTVRNNYTNYFDGGGVYLLACPQASFVDCTLSGNQCLDGGFGAGLAADSSTVTMTGCAVDSNSAYVDHEAGGIGLASSSLWFTDGEITNNFSARGGGIGVGIFPFGGGTLLLEDSVVAGNTAHADQALGNGGGLHVRAGSIATVKRCVFDSNTASGLNGSGGAVFGPADLEHCTLVGNSANVGGGACGAALDSCISYFNTPLGTCSSTNVTYSDVEGGHAGIGNINADPTFWNLTGGDFHLKPGSPCIDTGNPASPLDPDGSLSDMGAFPFDAGYCPPAETYCTAGVSAAGCQAAIGSLGTPSASAPNGFLLLASKVEGQRDGLFFFGTNGRQANPWGNGTSYQCVIPPVKRGPVLAGVGTTGTCNGAFAFDLNAHWTSKPSSNPGSGVLVQAQLWYRDPLSTSNQTTSLSDAIEAGVCP